MAPTGTIDTLPGALVSRVEELIKQIAPDVVFEYDEASMVNIKIDDVQRDKTFAYIEEVETSRIVADAGRPARRITPLSIYFCRFEQFQNDAGHGDTRHSKQAAEKTTPSRQQIRDELETSVVLPFIARVLSTRQRWYTPTITINYPPARFDANEVPIEVTIEFTEYICIEYWQNGKV